MHRECEELFEWQYFETIRKDKNKNDFVFV